MNQLDKLAREKFNGDMFKTAEYVFTSLSGQEQYEITKDMTGEQASEFNRYLSITAKNNGINIEKIVKEEHDLALMNLSKEDVIKMEVNPFKAKIAKDILKFVILNSGLVALYFTASTINKDIADIAMSVGLSVTSILNTMFSFETVKDALNFFKFKKMKKQYEKEKNMVDDETLNNSRRSL